MSWGNLRCSRVLGWLRSPRPRLGSGTRSPCRLASMRGCVHHVAPPRRWSCRCRCCSSQCCGPSKSSSRTSHASGYEPHGFVSRRCSRTCTPGRCPKSSSSCRPGCRSGSRCTCWCRRLPRPCVSAGLFVRVQHLAVQLPVEHLSHCCSPRRKRRSGSYASPRSRYPGGTLARPGASYRCRSLRRLRPG